MLCVTYNPETTYKGGEVGKNTVPYPPTTNIPRTMYTF